MIFPLGMDFQEQTYQEKDDGFDLFILKKKT